MSRPYAADSAFSALAHPIRRRILELLLQRDRTVTDIASHFTATIATVSQHLRVLRTAGVVSQRRVKRHRLYSIQRRSLRPVSQWMRLAESPQRVAAT